MNYETLQTMARREGLLILLQGGADPNSTEPQGISALLLAVTKGKADVVSLLIKAGADPFTSVHGKMSPLERAAGDNDVGLLKILVESSRFKSPEQLWPALICAVTAANVKVVEYLLGRSVPAEGSSDLAARRYAEAVEPYKSRFQEILTLLQQKHAG